MYYSLLLIIHYSLLLIIPVTVHASTVHYIISSHCYDCVCLYTKSNVARLFWINLRTITLPAVQSN